MKTKREKSALNYLKIEKKTDIRKRRKSANDYLTYTGEDPTFTSGEISDKIYCSKRRTMEKERREKA